MTTKMITPMELFREFSAKATDAQAAGEYSAAYVYHIGVDWADGFFKGLMQDQWVGIYHHILKSAKDNRQTCVILSAHSAEALAWNDVMETMEIAIAIAE